MRILKILPDGDKPTNHNYDINYGVWDKIIGDYECLESFNADLDEYDVVFLPMFKRWRDHTDLLNRIKDHKIKKVMFDNDTCYRSFDHEYYQGIDYIFYRGLDIDGKRATNGSLLPWSVDHTRYTPVYGGDGVSFPCSISDRYPLRKKINKIIKHSLHETSDYIEVLQNSAASIHTNSDISPVVRAKVLEFAACGTQIISNKCWNMEDYFPDDLIIYFDSIDHLSHIINRFTPNVRIQKRLRAIVEDQHTHDIRAKQILDKL